MEMTKKVFVNDAGIGLLWDSLDLNRRIELMIVMGFDAWSAEMVADDDWKFQSKLPKKLIEDILV